MLETLARDKLREPLADGGRELETVARARRADHEATAALEDERLVRRGRVEAGLRGDGVGLGEAVGLARPARDLFDQARLRLAGLVRVDLGARVVGADLEAVNGI